MQVSFIPDFICFCVMWKVWRSRRRRHPFFKHSLIANIFKPVHIWLCIGELSTHISYLVSRPSLRCVNISDNKRSLPCPFSLIILISKLKECVVAHIEILSVKLWVFVDFLLYPVLFCSCFESQHSMKLFLLDLPSHFSFSKVKLSCTESCIEFVSSFFWNHSFFVRDLWIIEKFSVSQLFAWISFS